MNKLADFAGVPYVRAVTNTAPKAIWQPIIYFWEGGWLGVGSGRDSVLPEHSHHTVQITFGLDGPIGFRSPEEDWLTAPGAIVRPNAPHEFHSHGSIVMFLFVEPETREGRWLVQSLDAPITLLPAERVAPHMEPLLAILHRRPSLEQAAALITTIAGSLREGPPPRHKPDERIARALAYIRANDARGLSLEQVAREAFLSPSRFAHLFTEEMGLPFRRYLLWRKLSRAFDAFGRGGSLSQAAHAAGLADAAHLTRTFLQMFGIQPSLLLSAAELHEIPAPFEIDLPAAP